MNMVSPFIPRLARRKTNPGELRLTWFMRNHKRADAYLILEVVMGITLGGHEHALTCCDAAGLSPYLHYYGG